MADSAPVTTVNDRALAAAKTNPYIVAAESGMLKASAESAASSEVADVTNASLRKNILAHGGRAQLDAYLAARLGDFVSSAYGAAAPAQVTLTEKGEGLELVAEFPARNYDFDAAIRRNAESVAAALAEKEEGFKKSGASPDAIVASREAKVTYSYGNGDDRPSKLIITAPSLEGIGRAYNVLVQQSQKDQHGHLLGQQGKNVATLTDAPAGGQVL